MPVLDEAGSIDVCGVRSFYCDQPTNTCKDRCTDDVDCDAPGGGTHCNLTTGRCECTMDDECGPTSFTGFSKCNLTTKRCECATNADCQRPDGGALRAERDVCVAGVCSCSSNSACLKTFPGTTEACQ